MALELGNLFLVLGLHAGQLLLFALMPEVVQVLEELIDQVWREVVAVLHSEGVCHSKGLLRHPLLGLLLCLLSVL